MKKLIALLMVCGFAFAFVACGGQKTEEASEETETVEEPAEEPVVEEPAVEEPADSAATDTTGSEM